MKYLSVCSGIEAASVAWHQLGWEAVGYSEIEPFPSAVLAHRFTNVPNYGDMTKFKEWNIGKFDILVGGTPCQSFSIAGLRKGLSDPRGNLMLTFGAIADYYKPAWIVWENVPGVLSSNRGKDFGTFLGMLGELGYGFAYRVLDAQYFGVAQRRRRVFVVGYLGDWRRAAAVLFESESMQWHPAPSREAGQRVAQCLSQSLKSSGGIGMSNQELFSQNGGGLTLTGDGAMAFNAQGSSSQGLSVGEISPTLDKSKVPATYGIPGNWIGRKPENGGNAVEPMHDVSPCLTKTDRHGVCCLMDQGGSVKNIENDMTGTLRRETKGHEPIIFPAVRRLTPKEFERLQGFPDDWTLIPWRGKPAPDGPRYKACGNSMAVPVMRWIVERIVKV